MTERGRQPAELLGCAAVMVVLALAIGIALAAWCFG